MVLKYFYVSKSRFSDTKDYLYTILLNAVLPTTCRFSDHMGKKIRKETISDCQESMVLKLTNLNNYQTKINTMISKYYNAGKKALLNRDCSDWDLVCANWKDTFPLSQRESKEMDSVTFFQQ